MFQNLTYFSPLMCVCLYVPYEHVVSITQVQYTINSFGGISRDDLIAPIPHHLPATN